MTNEGLNVQDHHDKDDHDEYSYEERVEKLATLTVGVAKGILPTGQILLLMHQIANSTVAPPEIRAFTHVLLRIANGERDPAIGADLTDHLAQVVVQVIDQIEAPLPESTPEEAEAEGVSLEELLVRVGEACTGNVVLWQQLWNFTETLGNAPASPPDIKALADVLRKILAGERQKHILEKLPANLADPVEQLLDQLLNYPFTSPPKD